ncbi:MAG: cation:proton antiporter [Gammaproteobacteria bacterium]|nr:cation:proton antiporter [Gammaproteobacteria bacterium]MCW5583248.1 cation:proton antiporter [Gammaproteobacteria bacterium]
MYLLPKFPLHLNPIALFGLTLLLGLIGGEAAKRVRFLPIISGYIAVGFLVGPGGFNIVTPSLLANTHIFVEISLGLILFDLGRHLDFAWLRQDHGIIPMAIFESLFTFILVFTILYAFQFPWIYAALAASISIATSAAVVMMIAHDLDSKGPVTRRALILTSLNNLIGILIFTFLLPLTQSNTSFSIMAEHTTYKLLGSVIFGALIFIITLGIAYFIGKRNNNQFVLFVGSIIFAIGLSGILNLSSMITLFTLGICARNFDWAHLLIEIDFGWIARLFFIVLFVVTGVHLQLQGLWQATWIVLAILLARTIAKSCGIWLFASTSRLTHQQSWALSMALTPMAGLAIGMSNIILDFNPNFGYQLMTIITTVVAVLNIIGPIATQVAFIKSNEALQ